MAIEWERALVLGAAIDMKTGREFGLIEKLPKAYAVGTWLFLLDELDDWTTRLIVRYRVDYSTSVGSVVMWRLLTEPTHTVMERKMVRGIKRRAEGAAARPTLLRLLRRAA